jgi:4-amino-4-deoxy-L-arabinose transferase-like glycosyltransferase
LAFLATGICLAASSSATTDEVPHIAAGALYRHGEMRLNREHPPLTKLLATLALPERKPALALPAQLPATDFQWEFGREYLYGWGDPLAILLRARLPLVLLNCLMLIGVAVLAHWTVGSTAASVAVLLAATCPTWLAHATLVTTDAPATCFFVGSVVCGAWLLRAQSQRQRLAASAALVLALALAEATKYSMLSASPLVALGLLFDVARWRRWQLLPWVFGASLVGALLGVCFAWGMWKPAAYLEGVRLLGHNHLHGYWFYAFGNFSREQDFGYFARALLVKVSLPTLVLAVFAWCAWALARRRTLQKKPQLLALLIVPPLGYLVLMSVRAPALGVRYVLPVLPFLFIAAGSGATRLLQSYSGRICLGLAAMVQAGSLFIALAHSPISFFNGLFCQTGQIPACLDDSNVDWGQALPALRRYRDAHYPGRALRLFYFGSSRPEAYVPRVSVASPLELLQPQGTLYAVSLHLLVRTPDDAWTRKLQPVAVVAGAYAVYDLSALQ